MLHEFVVVHREEIILRCRAKVATRSIPPPTELEIDHGVPLFLDQLVDALRVGTGSSPAIGKSALMHGHDLRRQGFTVSQVVHGYGDVCQSITELAMELSAPISADDFRMLNACLDDAIAVAVTQHAREGNQSAIDGETARGGERLGFFVHELRNFINSALIAFDVLKTGNVGVGGSTGAVLHRSLVAVRDLISRSLAEIRLTQGIQNPRPFLVSGFIEELLPAASLAAGAGGIAFTAMPVEHDVAIEADRQVLAAVVMNLLQNAFKFTLPGTAVTLRVRADAARVFLEVEDECGGLADVDVEQLFNPFDQQNADRTGLGLGLAFSRWGAEANHGRIYARDIPGAGCVFTVDLPRLPVSALATS
jgi:signal transduction histidine kinase